MKKSAWLSCMALIFISGTVAVAANDTRCYEMRTYHAAPEKMEDLHKRFRDHTLKLFAKHGMENLGYWVTLDKEGKKENKLIFLLGYPSREAREQSWKNFMADPEWQAAYRASEADGRLVERFENTFLKTTDYSPDVSATAKSPSRIFELRTYKASSGNLDRLNARFRNHTVKLFSKHGMSHFGYWTPMKDQKGAEDTLIYILAHESREAAAASFDSFRKDPAWVEARKASEADAGGSLTAPNGVQSVFMVPTDYSPTK